MKYLCILTGNKPWRATMTTVIGGLTVDNSQKGQAINENTCDHFYGEL